MATRNAAFTIQAVPAGDRRIKFIASTDGIDRHGTRLLPRGCRYENYLKNPVFLWNHRKHEEAEPDDVIGRAISVTLTDSAVEIVVEFDTAPKADRCLQLVRRGMLRAVSVGFIPLVEHPRFNTTEDADAFLARGGVIEVREWELCELSLTIVPSNPDALVTRSFALRAPRGEACAMLVCRPDGMMLWGKRRDSGLYTTPAGKLNSGEAPEACAVRELFEEAGLRAVRMQKLGISAMARANVHCFRAEVPADAQPTVENDSDKEVVAWEWRATVPAASEIHHKPDALLPHYPKPIAPVKSARTYVVEQTKTVLSIPSLRGSMDPKVIFEKLGITEGVKPEEIAAALIKYLTGPDADADKQALVMGLLSMLVPAPSAESADPGQAVAMEAMVDEVRKLQARVAEMEAEKARAAQVPQPSPEERADAAIRDGRWPMGQRPALVDAYSKNKAVTLLAEKTFSTRSVSYTNGGNPTAAKPPTFEPAKTASIGKSILDEVAARLGKSNGTN
jgi:HK97 family phage prohead protease